MKTYTLKLEAGNEFVQGWILDAVCNSTHKGVLTNTLKAADLLGEAQGVYEEASDPNSDVVATQLDRLRVRIEMHDEQRNFFEAELVRAKKAYCEITGKSKWVPYTAKTIGSKSKTDTNAFFSKRTKGSTGAFGG